MREIEHLSRLYVAWQFVCAEETKLKSAEDLQLMQSSISELQSSMQRNADRIRELSDEIKVLEKSRDKVVHLKALSLNVALEKMLRYNTF